MVTTKQKTKAQRCATKKVKTLILK